MRLPFLPVLLLAFIGTAQAEAPAIRVMSFNIRFDEAEGYLSAKENAWLAPTGSNRRSLALQVIAQYDPDLLGLQEPLNNQVQDVRAHLPKHGFYGVGRDDGEHAGEYCALFYRKSRFEQINQGTFWLNEQADKPGSRFPKTCCARITSWVVVKDMQAEGQEYFVLNTHWDHQIQEARLFSANLIRQRVVELAEGRPILVMGDLNVPPENPAFTRLTSSEPTNQFQLIDSYREAHPKRELKDVRDKFRLRAEEGTFNNFKGWTYGNRIDFILHTEHFRAVEASISRFNKEGRYPSDHFPVTATLQLRGQ